MRILGEGTRLADRYTLIRRLGTGGMAEVWLASDKRADARIALKLLVGEAATDPQHRNRLQREWRIGARLMHPNIIRVFEFHDDPDGAFYGLQYVGETSMAVLCGGDPAETMRPVGMIADALRYAHGKGIVHRDIKATNILLDRRGIPCLLDFGVAAQSGSSDMADSGSAVASSPQQRSGAAAQAADDIYALGVLMHELLTGAPPHDGQVSTALQDGSEIAAGLRSLLSDMLSADAARRPAAETVAQRLAAAGYPAGAAPSRYVAGRDAVDEVVATAAPISAARRGPLQAADAATAQRASSGISPAVLYGGLGGAILVLLAVVFLLPSAMRQERATDNRPAVVAGEQAPAELSAADATIAGEPADGGDAALPGAADRGRTASFSENVVATGSIKSATDDALGDLLSQLERLRYRAIDRWGGQPYLDAVDVYGAGDRAYIDRNYRLAGEKYREASKMLAPFFDRIDTVFSDTLEAAREAFAAGDHAEAVRLFDLAVSITPGNREAETGLARAKNLQTVLSLMEQGLQFEKDLELDAARLAFEKALELDRLWEPAALALERVQAALKNLSFEQRMTEGFDALASGDFATARAAFNAAKLLNPASTQPGDGLLQVDQEVRLAEIRRLEKQATELDRDEQWEASVQVYENILNIDPDLLFAKQGLAAAQSRAALHARLQNYIDDPDGLSDPATMQNATNLLLSITRMEPLGPRLVDQKNELSRLLKRAATPLQVRLVSDNQTDVSLFKVGRFGTFMARDIELRPGSYVAVGIRPGFRDVRVEFRVAPEVEMQPIVIQCEEPI